MRARADRLADALVRAGRARGFEGPGTVMISVDGKNRVTQVEWRSRDDRAALAALPAVPVTEEPS